MLSYVVFLVSLSVSIVAYRLSPFHPLARFKGPIIVKVSKLWGLWIAGRGSQYLYHKKLHDQYGPWVRTGPNELSVIDAPAVSQILNFGGLDKGRFYEAHTAKRRVWNRAVTGAALREYEPLVAKRATQLMSRLVEIYLLNITRLDVMGDLAFGGAFEALREGKDVAGIGEKISAFMTSGVALSGQIPWISPTLHLFPQVGRGVQALNEFSQRLAVQRVEKGGSGVKDLWYHVSDEAGLEKVRPTLESSATDGIVAVVGASDTTVSTMTSLVWFLLSNQEYYRRVRLEIDTVFVDGDDPRDVSKHEQLQFLSACINETLRLHPPLPSNGPRGVDPKSGGRVIAGRFIPAGTTVYTPPYALHRNPAYFFPHTDHFVPERWLPGSNFEKHDTSAFIPFSLGPANCVGQKFARGEILVVVSLLLKSFDLKFVDGFDSEGWALRRRDYFVATRTPLLVNLTPRESFIL
ncbi:cytochrome P450 [Mycena rosella]|uniref:Cytochrome P450 n=1 Tax=Mycena rosella TaxID=1033263 RepID=A0AAD7CNL9_MYCRO|nr:cytochrome P450 [Mycena rosella]